MDIQPVSNNKFIVGLSNDDMVELNITYDEMDYSNIETRRVIWTILDNVRRDTGRDVDPSGNLMIEVAPNPSGGCLMMFTVANGSGKNSQTVVSKINSTRFFEFENADDLLDFLKQLKNSGEVRLFACKNKYRIELTPETANALGHILKEYASFVGKDAMTAALTYEHWKKLSLAKP